ncbi:Hypothetical predicted protein [Paramuricea clavata]|uniref:Uncharacterized protein n=1 Tax=Paramuricea clavata TaxID=317549 RepID=A0A6S7FQL6_PARCT|nr:Hypothetical predicted protein [Paramuricea clavata]
MITEQSRQAYIAANNLQEREKAAEESIIVSSDSGDSEAELLATEGVPDCLIGNVVTEILRKRRAAIQRKAVRRSKAKIAAQRFLRRQCEGIGEVVEEYVRSCRVGADAWRQTGVLTFDGNRKVKKKATFKGIKEYLERKVDGAPCASTSIHLYKGPKSDTYQKENEHFKVFIKGNKAAKEKLKKTPPELFAKFERVAQLRKVHGIQMVHLCHIFQFLHLTRTVLSVEMNAKRNVLAIT